MKETRYFYVPDAARQSELPEEEAGHALRVLRLKAGDEMFLMDGVGTFFRAEVTVAAGKHCMYEIKDRFPQHPTWRGHIHLAIAPTKMMERMEWMVEKAAEVGFDEISFLGCKFSERKVLRADRVEKIVVSAMKQSRKAWKPVVNTMCSFGEFMAVEHPGRKYICHCYEEFPKKDFFNEIQETIDYEDNEDILVLVGPEGDFSVDEVQLALEKGYESVSLGRSRLRTETAGLSAVMMANLARRIQ